MAVHIAVVGLSFAEGGSSILNADAEHVADGAIEGVAFVGGQGAGTALRMEGGFPEGFVGINIADTGDEGLVEQQRFEGAFAGGENGFEIGSRKGVGERIGP